MTHDLVIRNAHLVDGSGQPGRDADVAVDGDGFVFLAQNYTWVEAVRTDVAQAITDGDASKRTSTGAALSFDGRFARISSPLMVGWPKE